MRRSARRSGRSSRPSRRRTPARGRRPGHGRPRRARSRPHQALHLGALGLDLASDLEWAGLPTSHEQASRPSSQPGRAGGGGHGSRRRSSWCSSPAGWSPSWSLGRRTPRGRAQPGRTERRSLAPPGVDVELHLEGLELGLRLDLEAEIAAGGTAARPRRWPRSISASSGKPADPVKQAALVIGLAARRRGAKCTLWSRRHAAPRD